MARLFELENNQIEKQNRLKGIISSVLFHVLLLMLFYFIVGVKRPFPPLEERGGVMVNLGYMDEGSGEIQPMGASDVVEIPQPVKTSTTPEKVNNDKIISQDNSDVVINTKKKDNKKENKKEVKPQKTTPALPVVEAPKTEAPPKPKAMYTGGSQNNSTGEGPDKTGGDKGQVNGSPFGDSYTGGPGLGGGPGGVGPGGTKYSLNGRKMVTGPCSITDKSQETGIIVLRIKVNKSGNVISADGPYKGSTTTSSSLLSLAKSSLKCCKFDTPAGVPDEQFGTITFNFKVK